MECHESVNHRDQVISPRKRLLDKSIGTGEHTVASLHLANVRSMVAIFLPEFSRKTKVYKNYFVGWTEKNIVQLYIKVQVAS